MSQIKVNIQRRLNIHLHPNLSQISTNWKNKNRYTKSDDCHYTWSLKLSFTFWKTLFLGRHFRNCHRLNTYKVNMNELVEFGVIVFIKYQERILFFLNTTLKNMNLLLIFYIRTFIIENKTVGEELIVIHFNVRWGQWRQ